jgi:hypothetical protein
MEKQQVDSLDLELSPMEGVSEYDYEFLTQKTVS